MSAFTGMPPGLASPPTDQVAELDAISSMAAIHEAEKAMTPRHSSEGKVKPSPVAQQQGIPPCEHDAWDQEPEAPPTLDSLLPPPAFDQLPPLMHSHFRAILAADKAAMDCSPREGRTSVTVGVLQEEWGL